MNPKQACWGGTGTMPHLRIMASFPPANKCWFYPLDYEIMNKSAIFFDLCYLSYKQKVEIKHTEVFFFPKKTCMQNLSSMIMATYDEGQNIPGKNIRDYLVENWAFILWLHLFTGFQRGTMGHNIKISAKK